MTRSAEDAAILLRAMAGFDGAIPPASIVRCLITGRDWVTVAEGLKDRLAERIFR